MHVYNTQPENLSVVFMDGNWSMDVLMVDCTTRVVYG